MIIELISRMFEGRIKLQEPLLLANIKLPDALKDILVKSNGIMETMVIPQKEETIDIGWIIYSYDQICEETVY